MTTLKSEKVSLAELFRITGFDRHEISRKLVAAGVPFDLGDRKAHLYDKTMALAVLYNNPRAVSEDDAKKRKAVAEAEKAELVVHKIKGELVSAEEMKQAAAELIKTMFQRIVRVEPVVIASRCVGLDAVGIETEIRTAMQGIFSDLRFDTGKYLEIDNDEEIEEPDRPVPNNGIGRLGQITFVDW